MRKLSGPEWFKKYQGTAQRSNALQRLSLESGLNLKTLYRACIRALPVNADSAKKLVAIAGEALDVGVLCAPDATKALPLREQRKRGQSNSELGAAS